MPGEDAITATEAEFKEFEAAGEVETTVDVQPDPEDQDDDTDPNPDVNDQEDQDVETDQDDGETGEEDQDDEGDKKPKKSNKDHQIERLKREKAEMARQLRERENSELLKRLESLEKGLSPGNSSDNTPAEIPAPDPTDSEKYPLGHLDDRYIEDKLEWLAEKKAADRADAVLQRQRENERSAVAAQAQEQLLGKVDDLATRASGTYDDFQETVVEAGMRGDWDLSQPTFEAAHEAENGVQILYELAQDKKEAARVAKLSPYQQLKFVQERDAELSKGKEPRRIPRAGEPPKNLPRGANSRVVINPATDDLDDFEKLVEQDARKSRR